MFPPIGAFGLAAFPHSRGIAIGFIFIISHFPCPLFAAAEQAAPTNHTYVVVDRVLKSARVANSNYWADDGDG